MSVSAKKILLMGGTGFVGRELGRRLVEGGHQVAILTRRPEAVCGQLPFPCTIYAWDGGAQALPAEAINGCDSVVNLIGEGIADKPWTAARRALIAASRQQSTAALLAAIQAAATKPKSVIQASAVGFYGNHGHEPVDETTPYGRGFLAETCVAWENRRTDFARLGVRVATFRIGMVLGLSGGALPELLSVYSKGLGAVLGSGRQWMSWIHIDDLTTMMTAAIVDERWTGVFNASAPVPCTNAEFNKAIATPGRYLAGKTVPAVALRLAMGARAALVLDSVRVVPKAALELGFTFKYPSIEPACAALLRDAVQSQLRRFVRQQWVALTPEQLWPFFSDARNLERLTPPWLAFHVAKIESASPRVRDIGLNTRIFYHLKIHGIPMRWESLLADWQPGRSFVDTQVHGPYSVWHHTHLFEPLAGGTLITDALQYRLPLPPLGELAAGNFVAHDIEKIFAYRSKMIAALKPETL